MILLDKSTLQSLSYDELGFLEKHYFLVIPPVLVAEILGDLAKDSKRAPEDVVTTLANKLSGSDRKLNLPHQQICLGNLLGHPVDKLRPVVEGERVTSRNGKDGMLVINQPAEEALWRWRRSEFAEVERVLSSMWRDMAKVIDPDEYFERLSQRRVIVPSASNMREVHEGVSGLLAQTGNQATLLSFLLEEFNYSDAQVQRVHYRWRTGNFMYIGTFADYAEFCLRIILVFVSATRNNLVGRRRTNRIDLEYLFYLRFAHVFSSNDNVHEKLAPVLLETDQDYISGTDLKADLRSIKMHWDELSPQEQLDRTAEYACYPPDNDDSPTSRFWKKHMKPWKPGMGDAAARMSKEQHAQLLEKLRPYLDAIDDHENKKR